MPTFDTKRMNGVRLAHRCGLVLVCVFAVSGPSMAQTPEPETSDAQPAAALINPAVSLDELAHWLIPLTKDELDPLARAWLQIVRLKTEEIAERQVELLRDPSAATEDAYRELAQMVEARARLLQRFSMVVDAFESKGGNEALVAELRAYRSSVLSSETRLANPKAVAIAAFTWLTRADGGVSIARDVGLIFLVFVALVLVSKSVQLLFRRWIGRVPNMSKLLQSFLGGAVYWLVLTIGLLIAVAAIGVNVTPLFAMIGGASFILAFAFQDTLGNLASGLMIMINRPFDEGDYVEVGGTSGTVRSVSIVATTVTTPDNQVIVIPNKSVWGNVITNVTASDTRRVDLVFGIGYGDSIEEAQKVLENVVSQHPLVLDDPAPVIRVSELADSSVNFIVRPRTETSDYWPVYWDLQRAVKEAFDANGISIPFPQTDLHLHVADGGRAAAVLAENDAERP